MPTKALSERPPKVVLAVKFFYVVVGLGIIRAVMTVIRHADVRSPNFLILTKLIIYIGSFYLIYQISKGRNWARILTRKRVFDAVSEVLAVSGATAWVHEEDGITLGRKILPGPIPADGIHPVRSAMDP